MKKIIFLVSVIVLLIVFSYLHEYNTNDSIESKNLSKKKENYQVKNNKETILNRYEIVKVDQEYTIDSRNQENNIDALQEVVINEELPQYLESEEKIEDELVFSNQVEETSNEQEKMNIEIEKEDIEEKKEEAKEEQVEGLEGANEEVKLENIEVHYLKNGFFEEDGNTYYYENDNKITGLKLIDGVNNYFSPSGKYLGVSKVKVIDVSYYQKDINWDLFASESDCFGVILRLGYWTTLDKKFERNISELKRLNIPYGIYLFSYATSIDGARHEAEFTNNMIDKYDIKPQLGIYYDLESWKTNTTTSDSISKNGYNYIAKGYIESVSNHVNNNYIVGIYSGRWYAMNRLGNIAKSYVKWVAEYNSTLKYDGPYIMWQYTSKGNIPGIEGNVDISYLY